MSDLTLERVRVAWDGRGEEGLLVRHDGVLVGVLGCLDEPFYGHHQGRWNLEAGFGRCDAQPLPFVDLKAALRWIAGRLDIDAASVEPAVRKWREDHRHR